MRKLLAIVAPLAVIVAAVLVVVGLNATKPPPEKTEEEARPVALFVAEAQRKPVELTVSTQGEVRPRAEIDIIPQVSGRVVYVSPSFIEGGIVAPGETLIRIEARDFELAVTRAEAQVAEAMLALSRAEASAEIVRKQWEWDKLKKEEPTELGLRKPQVAEARSKHAAAIANLEAAKLDLARTRMSVPFNGRIRSKTVDVGQFISAGTPVGRAFSTEVVEIRLPLTDEQLARIGLPIAFNAGEGEGVKVTLSGVAAGERRHWTGNIVRTDATIDPETRLYYAIAEVRDPYGEGSDDGVPLPVGLFVDANIESGPSRDALVIPRAALRQNGIVYFVNDESKLEVRRVNVAASSPDRAVVTSGLEAGEKVVISPVRGATEGMVVEARSREEAAQLAVFGARGGEGGGR